MRKWRITAIGLEWTESWSYWALICFTSCALLARLMAPV